MDQKWNRYLQIFQSKDDLYRPPVQSTTRIVADEVKQFMDPEFLCFISWMQLKQFPLNISYCKGMFQCWISNCHRLLCLTCRWCSQRYPDRVPGGQGTFLVHCLLVVTAKEMTCCWRAWERATIYVCDLWGYFNVLLSLSKNHQRVHVMWDTSPALRLFRAHFCVMPLCIGIG